MYCPLYTKCHQYIAHVYFKDQACQPRNVLINIIYCKQIVCTIFCTKYWLKWICWHEINIVNLPVYFTLLFYPVNQLVSPIKRGTCFCQTWMWIVHFNCVLSMTSLYMELICYKLEWPPLNRAHRSTDNNLKLLTWFLSLKLHQQLPPQISSAVMGQTNKVVLFFFFFK